MSYSLAFSQALFITVLVADKVQQKKFEFTPTQLIAERLNIPPATVSMILRRLNRAGIIETKEGAGGGVRLALPPASVTVLDLFNAIEQERPMFKTNIQFAVTGEKPTKLQESVLGLLDSAEEAMRNQLSEMTVADLLTAIN